MSDKLLNQPLYTLTVGELLALLREELAKNKEVSTHIEPVKYLHSIKELSDLLGCSKATASKIKKSGRIRYRQVGRKLIFNTTEILEDLSKTKK